MNDQDWKKLGITSYDDITAVQMQDIYRQIRFDGLNLRQPQAAIRTIVDDDSCSQLSFFDVLHEMDRRYFLRRDLGWEFAMLDYWKIGVIEIEEAEFLMKAVHKDCYSQRKWNKFLKNRPVPEAKVAFEEIEVELCDVPNPLQVQHDHEEEVQEALGRNIIIYTIIYIIYQLLFLIAISDILVFQSNE